MNKIRSKYVVWNLDDSDDDVSISLDHHILTHSLTHITTLQPYSPLSYLHTHFIYSLTYSLTM